MIELENDIKELILKSHEDNKRIIMQIKSSKELRIILSILKEIDRCDNYNMWINNKKIIEGFDNEECNYISIDTIKNNTYFRSRDTIKYLGINDYHLLIGSNYIKRMPKKKLII